MAEPLPLPVFHVVGFTGHRQLRDPAGVARKIGEVLAELRGRGGADWIALSSVAEGADLVFARTARKLGLGWEALLPLPPADFRTDFSPETWRDVEQLLTEAEHVRVVSEAAPREDAYLDCGMETVNHCDVLLAVWDGAPARGRGGTADIVIYARELGRPIVIIDPETLAVRRENLDQLNVGDPHLDFLNRLPAAGVPTADQDSGRATVRAFQARTDRAASANAPHDKRLVALTIWLHVLATALATAGLAFDLHLAALPWGKLSCLLAALGLATLVRHRREQHDWVRCRLAAEVSRSTLATWGMPRQLRIPGDSGWPGLEPLCRSLDVLQRRAARAHPVTFASFKEHYIKERIDGQLSYFARQQGRAFPQRERLRRGFFICSLLALCFTAAYASHSLMPELSAPRWVQSWIYAFGPILLPVLAAAFMSLVHVNDLHRRVARYEELRGRLEAARKEASHAQTWGALERVVARVERALLQEVFEWHSLTSLSEAH